MNKYDCSIDFDTKNSITLLLERLKCHSKVLEFGPAHGRLTKYLKETMDCVVDIVEIDDVGGNEAKKYARKSFIGSVQGNIENYIWLDNLRTEQYEYIILADVLEHLYDPYMLLDKCKSILSSNGSILISIPNITHNSIILSLLNDRFDYTPIGLLDEGHIHFFSYYSFCDRISSINYDVVYQEAVYAGVGENEINAKYSDVSNVMADYLKNRKLGSVYQFIFEIKPKNLLNHGACLNKFINPFKYPYRACCYIMEDCDHSYNEQKVLRERIDIDIKEVAFDLSSFKDIKAIRIDPLDTSCIIKIHGIYGYLGSQKKTICYTVENGTLYDNNIGVFTGNDPQIHLSAEQKFNFDKVVLSYEVIMCESDSIRALEVALFEGEKLHRNEGDLKIFNYEPLRNRLLNIYDKLRDTCSFFRKNE